jgi:hypothetical protein
MSSRLAGPKVEPIWAKAPKEVFNSRTRTSDPTPGRVDQRVRGARLYSYLWHYPQWKGVLFAVYRYRCGGSGSIDR